MDAFFNYIYVPSFCLFSLGVVWLHNSVIEGSNTTINRLKEIGKKVFFATNNSTKTRDEFVEKAHMLEFNIEKVWSEYCNSHLNYMYPN